MLYLLLALFGCLTGVTTLLFGFGGGFVVVPLLYHLLTHVQGATPAAMQIAVATSTCVMIVSAALATRRHAAAGNLDRRYLWPLAGYIALGAVFGALLAAKMAADTLRLAFILYLAVTILDCVLRRGFMAREDASTRLLGHGRTGVMGTLIGVIASALGVGGSVMTVPMLRRLGLSMGKATAMASPLTLPVAIAGSATYMAAGWQLPASLGPEYIGYVNIPAFALLAAGSWLGTRMAAPLLGRLGDRYHAQIYIGLLVLVLLAMVLG